MSQSILIKQDAEGINLKGLRLLNEIINFEVLTKELASLYKENGNKTLEAFYEKFEEELFSDFNTMLEGPFSILVSAAFKKVKEVLDKEKNGS